MLDPKLFARELAERIIPGLEDGSITGVEGARVVAFEASATGDQMLKAGVEPEAVAAWVEAVMTAFLECLQELTGANDGGE